MIVKDQFTFYADDAYLKLARHDKMPQINVLGGILINKENEKKLISIIKEEKAKFTHNNLPIKWNFKDSEVTRVFKEFKKDDEHKILIQNSREIRLEIIRRSIDLDYLVIFSCIRSYSEKKKVIKQNKKNFQQIIFDNLLLRIGNAAKSDCEYQIIMDWPTENDPSPYNRSYYYLYNTYKTVTGNTNYCGPFCNINFHHSLLYAKCTHSPLLQFTDIIVGSFKDYLEMELHGVCESCIGKEAFDLYFSKIRKNGNIRVGYGIIVPTSDTDFKGTLKTLFNK